MPYILDGKDITNQSFIIGNTQYPSRWIEFSTLEERQSLGIVWVEPEPYIPEPYIPTIVTMRQARLQLITIGLYDTVNQAVATMGQAAQVEWEYAAIIERSNPFVQQMISLLGWSETQADDFFVAADKL